MLLGINKRRCQCCQGPHWGNSMQCYSLNCPQLLIVEDISTLVVMATVKQNKDRKCVVALLAF